MKKLMKHLMWPLVIALLLACGLPALAEPGAFDVTDKVAAMVRDNAMEVYPTNDLVTRDPAPGVSKKLRVDYTLGGEEQTITVYEKQWLRLNAPAGQKLVVRKAYYGDFAAPVVDVTQMLREAAKAGRIEMMIDNRKMGGDPAPGRQKVLQVNYTVGGRPYTVESPEKQSLQLPAPGDGSGALEIIAARYGDPKAPKPAAHVILSAQPAEPEIVPNAIPSPPPTEFYPWPVPAVYQWSVPVEGGGEEKRAYLWIPENASHVRGLLVGLQNMLEKPMFQDPTIRQACADARLGIVWISPGHCGDQDQSVSILFKEPDKQWASLLQTLAALAQESGYAEVAHAPMITVGHSAASPFVYGTTEKHPERVFAAIPFKGWFPGGIGREMPILHVSSETAEWDKDWGSTWDRKDRPALLKYRSYNPAPMLGEFVDVGTGHFTYNPESSHILAMFIRKAAEARLPTSPSAGQVQLKPIALEDGVLVDHEKLGTRDFVAVPYTQYSGDKAKDYWYIDRDMAKTVNDYMLERFSRKPQVITFLVDGKPDLLRERGFTDKGIRYLDDGFTFEVEAAFLDQSPSRYLYAGQQLGRADSPIQFRVASGGIRQVGPNRFQPYIDRGGVERQGPPWENWVLAYHPGDATYRAADRPRHVWVPSRNTGGAEQSIEFPAIGDVKVGDGPIALRATASSGKPVQYFVISGPVLLEGDTLVLQPIPPSSRFPVKVMVAAYQWGSAVEPRVQSAGPVVREFSITQR